MQGNPFYANYNALLLRYNKSGDASQLIFYITTEIADWWSLQSGNLPWCLPIYLFRCLTVYITRTICSGVVRMPLNNFQFRDLNAQSGRLANWSDESAWFINVMANWWSWLLIAGRFFSADHPIYTLHIWADFLIT